ncbi:deaminase [Helicobacter monodelphidis]|uniref:RidA family protein n=1 Tax=Helicobacter sp. 15-1451 TaxID=2004995 RepID=UPI000DCEE4E2|nr:RidA family protein [Helicobacter sp. 15-1451]RAX56781.1 deaminase [Helicobacter sp. 15-1451]
MRILQTQDAPSAIGPYSQAIDIGSLIFTSGQIALTPQGDLVSGGIKEQTKQVLENLKAVLQSGQSSLQQVIKTTVFLSNMDHFNDFNEIYGQYFIQHKPARSTVAVKTLPKNVLVEIECIALKNS